MSVQHAPNGIKIGPDLEMSSEDDRLPIYDFDEWAINVPTFTLDGGEVTIITVTGLVTARPGSQVVAQPQNFHEPLHNLDKLQVKFARVVNAGEVEIMVKNESSSQVTFGEDQWLITFWCTVSPS